MTRKDRPLDQEALTGGPDEPKPSPDAPSAARPDRRRSSGPRWLITNRCPTLYGHHPPEQRFVAHPRGTNHLDRETRIRQSNLSRQDHMPLAGPLCNRSRKSDRVLPNGPGSSRPCHRAKNLAPHCKSSGFLIVVRPQRRMASAPRRCVDVKSISSVLGLIVPPPKGMITGQRSRRFHPAARAKLPEKDLLSWGKFTPRVGGA